MMDEIELGDKVKCKYTGFVGIAVAKTKFINGCVQYTVVPKWDKKTEVEDVQFDEISLEIVKKAKTEIEEEEKKTGGPMRRATKFKGY